MGDAAGGEGTAGTVSAVVGRRTALPGTSTLAGGSGDHSGALAAEGEAAGPDADGSGVSSVRLLDVADPVEANKLGAPIEEDLPWPLGELASRFALRGVSAVPCQSFDHDVPKTANTGTTIMHTTITSERIFSMAGVCMMNTTRSGAFVDRRRKCSHRPQAGGWQGGGIIHGSIAAEQGQEEVQRSGFGVRSSENLGNA